MGRNPGVARHRVSLRVTEAELAGTATEEFEVLGAETVLPMSNEQPEGDAPSAS
jgi:hypothetical protein